MTKKIIFSLLLIATATTHGMKRDNSAVTIFDNPVEMVLYDSDLMPKITNQLCIKRSHWNNIKSDLCALSNTNRFLRIYYAEPTNQQDIIKCCSCNGSPYDNPNDKDSANHLGYNLIHAEIERFINIALNKDKYFSDDDLKKTWYLNTTTAVWSKFLKKSLSQSLLQVALNRFDATKVIQIIDHATTLDFYYGSSNNLLRNIAQERDLHKSPTGSVCDTNYITEDEYNDLLKIAEHLLKKNILPDGRGSTMEYTPLMLAVTNKDKPLVRLLLEYGADLYTQYLYYPNEKKRNAFDFTKKKQWLEKIIDKITKNKKALGL